MATKEVDIIFIMCIHFSFYIQVLGTLLKEPIETYLIVTLHKPRIYLVSEKIKPKVFTLFKTSHTYKKFISPEINIEIMENPV